MAKKISLDTVNVIEVQSFDPFNIDELTSFPETPEGNMSAEALFTSKVMDVINQQDYNEADREQAIELALDNGVFTDGDGGVVITHSTATVYDG